MSDSPQDDRDSPEDRQEGRSVLSRTLFASFRSNRTRANRMGFSSPESSEPTRRPQRTATIEQNGRLRPSRNRSPFPHSKTWDGKVESFPTFRRMIEGHLLQVGAGYLLDENFLDKYRELGESYFETDMFCYRHDVGLAQARYDNSYLYGILLTTNRKNPMCPLLEDPTYKDTQDGILCWQAFCERYSYQGRPLSLEIERLEKSLQSPCESTVNYTEFRSFLDQHETNVYILQKLLRDRNEPVSDGYIKERLVWSLSSVEPAHYLTQKIRDTESMDYRESLRYLGLNAAMCPWQDPP